MTSPFPGMDPYIEECGLFEDFHQELIGEVKRELARVVPERYVVRTGERPYIVLAESEGKKEHVFIPDVGIVSPAGAAEMPASSASVAVAEPNLDGDAVSMRAFITTEFQESFVEIYMVAPERVLVTCIEILSPSNKRANSPGREIYLRKRQSLLMGTANFVEIDLLRGGDKMPMADPWPHSAYHLLVARKATAPRCRVWPGHFQRALPRIPVPLAHPDPDVQLDIQPMVQAIYARSRYDRDIDYARSLSPRLSDEESIWFAEQLRQRE